MVNVPYGIVTFLVSGVTAIASWMHEETFPGPFLSAAASGILLYSGTKSMPMDKLYGSVYGNLHPRQKSFWLLLAGAAFASRSLTCGIKGLWKSAQGDEEIGIE